MKVDAMSAIESLRALGNDIIPEFVLRVERVADASEVSFSKAARALPNGWRQLAFAARMIEDIDEAGSLAGAFLEVRKKRDLLEVESFFAVLGAERLALALAEAREKTALLVDEDMDPFDIDELCDVTADSLGLARVRAALTARAKELAQS